PRGRPPPPSPLFPYTTLFRSEARLAFRRIHERVLVERLERVEDADRELQAVEVRRRVIDLREPVRVDVPEPDRAQRRVGRRAVEDRKSTRLNSSHVKISYAVF